MSKEKEFKRKLRSLFDKRTFWLTHILGGRPPGPAPKWDKATVNATVKKLQALACKALARRYFDKAVDKWGKGKPRRWHVTRKKGWGRGEKQANFKDWYRKKVGSKGCVYLFSNGSKRIYVGMTKGRGSRPASHFDKHWFPAATNVAIRAVKDRRNLRALECLAIHRYPTRKNKQKTSVKCPLCQLNRRIKAEVRFIFRRRQRRRRGR